MKSQWKEFLQYVKTRGASVSMDEKEREEESAYEEMKQRLYTLHLEADHLFYVDSILEVIQKEEDSTGILVGEPAKGYFLANDPVLLLDQKGLLLMEAQILEKKEEEAEAKGFTRSGKKMTLTLSWKSDPKAKEAFLQTQYLRKKEEGTISCKSGISGKR